MAEKIKDPAAKAAGEKAHAFLSGLGRAAGLGELRETTTMDDVVGAFARILNIDEDVLAQLGSQNMDSFARRSELGAPPVSSAVSMALEGMVFGYLLRCEQEGADRG